MGEPNRFPLLVVCLGLCLTLVHPTLLSAQEQCPEAANADTEMGWILLREGGVAESRQAFTRALQRCPFHLGARTGMGYVEMREGRDEEAQRLLEGVAEVVPDNIDALTGLGILAWRQGELFEVGRIFNRIEELDSGNPTAADYLGRLPAAFRDVPDRGPVVKPDTLEYLSRSAGDYLEIRGPEGWERFYVKGVNLGAALPGKNPSEFPEESVYAEWIREIGEMGANTIRVYTIHPPHFYTALREYNLLHPDRPLWLLHGVWAELPPEHDYLDPEWEAEFFREMRRVVDLVHGQADILPRPGHAAGSYVADVSRWVLGYILGREWEPFSVMGFQELHPGFLSWEGEYVSVRGGNAMDAWMGKAVDETVRYEVETYNHQRPVSYTNWPTLDPLQHPTETTVEEEMAIREALGEVVDVRPREYDNDAVGLDVSLLDPTQAFPAGVFATFHAYPYYPDFMTVSPEYAGAASTLGPSDYFGYLTALKNHHPGIPVIIAEYGVPTSLGIAHLQPQGWHHGGHTEEEMAAVNRRLTLEIAEAGMAGGAIFAWIDEWFKKNWIVLEFELPPERNRFWLNRLDAEQHYGMIAMRARPPVEGASLADRQEGWEGIPALYEDEDGTSLRAATDAAYLWLHLQLPENRTREEVFFGFDIIDPEAGDFRWPGAQGPELPVGLEFVLQVDDRSARIMVDPPQNPFRFHPVGVGTAPSVTGEWPGVVDLPGFFRARSEQRFNVPYVSVENRDGVYDSLRVIVNRRRVTRDSLEVLGRGYDRGVLTRGEEPDGQWGWSADGRTLEVRIPWMLLNFTDPSQRRILQGPSPDPLQTPGVELTTAMVEGVRIILGVRGEAGDWLSLPRSGDPTEVALFSWPTWDDPEWESRRRPTFYALKETYEDLGGPVIAARDRADLAWGLGETDRAARLYSDILASDSTDSRALHRMALILAWEGDHTASLDLFDRLLAQEPENLEAAVDRARVLAWQGELDEAIGALEELLAADPGYSPALEARAQFLSWAGEYTEALSSYDQLVGISQDPTEALLAQARVLGWASRLEESWAVYDSILAVSPGNLDARLGKARLLTFADRTDEAVAAYEAILQDHAGNPEARRGLARALTWGGRLPEGEEAWRRAMATFTRDPVSRVGLAQNLRWQGRNAAAKEVLEAGDPDQMNNPDLLEQLRWVETAMAPRVRMSLIREEDSDDNAMSTVQMTAGWNVFPRLALEGEAYTRDLEQTALSLSNTSWGVNVRASLLVEPGWVVSAGAGGTRASGSNFTSLRAELTSPGRFPIGGGINLSRYPLDATAQLVEQGVEVEVGEVTGRWTPAPRWQVSGSAGVGSFTGERANRRLHGSARVTRRLARGFTLGLSHRYFGFEDDLDEYYFDPGYFGLSELTGRWLWEPGRISVLLEAAPGAQKIGSSGDYRGALRASASLAFRFGPGREISLSGGYSSAGLQSFSTGDPDYRYTAVVLSGNWVF